AWSRRASVKDCAPAYGILLTWRGSWTWSNADKLMPPFWIPTSEIESLTPKSGPNKRSLPPVSYSPPMLKQRLDVMLIAVPTPWLRHRFHRRWVQACIEGHSMSRLAD